jgi:hypothetical protein
MNQLLSITDTELSDNIGAIDPVEHDSIEVVNQTLNGQPHVQIIGSANKSIRFEILSTSAQVDLINALRSTGAKFKLTKESKYYIGLLIEKPTWERITKDYQTSVLKLNILEEGTL